MNPERIYHDLPLVMERFALNPADYKAHQIQVGLINQTILLQNQQGTDEHYILQTVNHHVFTDPLAVDHNIRLVTSYLKEHFPDHTNLYLQKAVDGTTLIQLNGQYYRLLNYISDAATLSTVDTARQAFEAASAFANFTRQLENFPVNDLQVTIPHFHSLPARAQQLEKAYSAATDERKRQAAEILNNITQQKAIIEFAAEIPFIEGFVKRVMHHDTKISNVLFDREDKSICVIDLDTVMPGYLFSDWGDMIRTYTCPVHESSVHFSDIHIRPDFLQAIFEGYTQALPAVTKTEKEHFIRFGEIMILMQAIRFMTDFLNNDIYYPVSHPLQNADRAKNQMTLLQRLRETE